MSNFGDLSVWVADVSSMFSTMFTSLGTIWVLYVPLALGVFGIVFGKIRGVLWNKKGGRGRKGG